MKDVALDLIKLSHAKVLRFGARGAGGEPLCSSEAAPGLST